MHFSFKIYVDFLNILNFKFVTPFEITLVKTIASNLELSPKKFYVKFRRL
jgi:hypothetical protein